MPSIDLNKWDEDYDDLGSDKQHLFNQLQEGLCHSPKNVDYLWRAAKVLTNHMASNSKRNKDTVQQKQFVCEAVSYAKKAIEADPQCFEAHGMYCASVGMLAEFVGIKERIKCGHEFKKHLEIGFELNPSSYGSYHMYGRFCYQIASISWLEKKLAASIFGELPQGSYEEALEALQKSDALNPNGVLNKLWISKTLIALKRYADAILWMDRALEMEVKTEEDVVCKEELIELKKKYSKQVI